VRVLFIGRLGKLFQSDEIVLLQIVKSCAKEQILIVWFGSEFSKVPEQGTCLRRHKWIEHGRVLCTGLIPARFSRRVRRSCEKRRSYDGDCYEDTKSHLLLDDEPETKGVSL